MNTSWFTVIPYIPSINCSTKKWVNKHSMTYIIEIEIFDKLDLKDAYKSLTQPQGLW